MMTTRTPDPVGTLAELRAAAERMRDLEREESALVRRARHEGFAWQAIAQAVGVSRQAMHKKYGRR